jgi:carbon storage regulator
MLVLSRAIDEAIVIDDRTTVRILSICDGIVRLGVTAPIEVPVFKEEIIKEIEQRIARERRCLELIN